MGRKTDNRIKMKHSADGKRTDRVKKAEREYMVKLRDKGKTIEEIANERGRNPRTVSKQLAKAKVLHQRDKTDPLIIKARERHFADLADAISYLLHNNVHRVWLREGTNQTNQPEYEIYEGFDSPGYPIARKQLSSMLDTNIEMLRSQKGESILYEQLVPHLNAEIPEIVTDIEPRGFLNTIRNNPYELIDYLRILESRKTFKGTCPVCEDW